MTINNNHLFMTGTLWLVVYLWGLQKTNKHKVFWKFLSVLLTVICHHSIQPVPPQVFSLIPRLFHLLLQWHVAGMALSLSWKESFKNYLLCFWRWSGGMCRSILTQLKILSSHPIAISFKIPITAGENNFYFPNETVISKACCLCLLTSCLHTL